MGSHRRLRPLNRSRRLLPWLALCCSLAACGGGQDPRAAAGPDAEAPPPSSTRSTLGPDMLLGSGSASGPVANRNYAPLGEYGPATAELFGTLRVRETRLQSNAPSPSSSYQFFPGFATGLFTYQDYLVPIQRGIIGSDGTGSHWRIILSPGRTWSEPADQGWSRAALPFVLVTDQSNEAHNGIATFLFDGQRISSIHFQVIQETASWSRHDYWGTLEAEFVAGAPDGLAEQREAFEAELGALPQFADWQSLPGGDAGALGTLLHRGLSAVDVSATGLIVDGTVYMPECATRYGPFPYCAFMRHGAYSVTKSTGALLAFLRLAQKFGEEVGGLRIADYVPIHADHDGWAEVTFADALNMATGVGSGNDDRGAVDPFADETPSRFHEWARAPSAADKLDVVFAVPDYPWGPGEVFRYNTGHTFLLGVAMQELLRRREGQHADLWEMVSSEVLAPIGVRAAPMMRTRESSGAGVALLGIGMYPTVADVARISQLLQRGGRHGTEQLLHRGLLSDALLQTGKGLPTGERNAHGHAVYHLSFWSLPFRGRDGCVRQLPYMNGFGGNFVMLLPNGLTAFRFADAELYDVESLALVADQIRSTCRP